MTTDTPKLRGFAHMKANNPERYAEITRRGGAGVPAEKRAFSQNLDLARKAGQEGGRVSKRKPKAKA